MTSKRLFSYASITFVACISYALIFVSNNKPGFMSTKAADSNGYSMTISDYDGGLEETYYTTLGNPINFEFRDCVKSDDGFAIIKGSSIIYCSTPVHGITSLLFKADNFPSGTLVKFTVFNGSTSYPQMAVQPNAEKTIEIPCDSFSVAFTCSSYFVSTGITFTYTCA